MSYPQKSDLLSIETPFGAEAVLLVGLRGEERMSGLFQFDLELVSMDRALDFKKIIGKGVTVTIKLSHGIDRYFHGICTRFRQAGRADKQTLYRAELHPWLWLLTRTTDSRIFQNESVPEIVKKIFSDLGQSDFEEALKGTYAKREYCVQYQETAFAFVSRLLEDEGIHYFFKHAKGKHTLVLCDDSGANPPCPGLAKARYFGTVGGSLFNEDAVTECELSEEIVVGGYATSDYNFETPSTSLLATADGEGGKLKLFEFPGEHATKGDGEARAKLRIEEEEAFQRRLFGSSYCRAFSAGHLFTLVEHDRDDLNNKQYVLSSVSHAAENEEYRNTFEAFPKEIPFRPRRVTLRPIIAGSQTAMVVGKKGEEIWTDAYGRIRVHFYWDRLGKKDDKSSCWMRVAQGWAGKGWGAFFLPRIGQEVIVSFLGGDPDRPIVTGSVYNAEQTVPYGLPGAQTKSTILGRSTKNGTAGNEIRFEDLKGSEELFEHAQKDMVFVVEHDWTISVHHDKTETIDHDDTLSVGHDQTVTVTKNRSVTVEEGDQSLTVGKGNRSVEVSKGSETHSVKGKRDLAVVGAESHANKANFTHQVEGNYVLQVKGNLVIEAKTVTIKTEKDMTLKSGKGLKSEAAGDVSTKADGKVSVKGSEVKLN